jgi:hypothetical protein
VRVTGTAQRDAWLARTFPPVERAGPGTYRLRGETAGGGPVS